MSEHVVRTTRGRVITNPPIARLLFDDTRFAVVWLVVRVLVGYEWLSAGFAHLTDPKWMAGDELKAFWSNAVQIPASGRPPIAVDWYRAFIQSLLDGGAYTWFAKLVAFGELLVGIALIIGLFVGIAAFFGGFMTFNYVMAGSASVNGLMFLGAVLLIMAWKTAGWYGLDRFVLPRFGTAWEESTKPDVPAPTPRNRNVTAVG